MNTPLPSSEDGVSTYALQKPSTEMPEPEREKPTSPPCIIVVRDKPGPGENWVEIDEVVTKPEEVPPADKKRRKPHV